MSDDNEGDPRLTCAGEPAPDCFHAPAAFKRVYLVDLTAPIPKASSTSSPLSTCSPSKIRTASAATVTGPGVHFPVRHDRER